MNYLRLLPLTFKEKKKDKRWESSLRDLTRRIFFSTNAIIDNQVTNNKEPRLFSALLLSRSLDLSEHSLDESTSSRPSPKLPSYRRLRGLVSSCLLLSGRLCMSCEPRSHKNHLLLVDCSARQSPSRSHPRSRLSLFAFLLIWCSPRHGEREIVFDGSLCDTLYISRDFVFRHDTSFYCAIYTWFVI